MIHGVDSEGKRLDETQGFTYLIDSHQIREILLVKVVVPVSWSPCWRWLPLEILGDH